MGAWRRALEKKIPEGVKGGACRVEGIDYWSDRPNPAKTGHKRPALCERPAKCGHFRPAETSLFPRNQPNSLIGASTIAEKRPNPAKSGHGDGWRVKCGGQQAEGEFSRARTNPDIFGHAVFPAVDRHPHSGECGYLRMGCGGIGGEL